MSSLLRGHGWNTTSNSIWQREQRWGGGFTVPYSISVIFNSCHHKSQRTAHWINPATYLQGRDILCLFKGGGRPDKGHLIQKPSSNLCATNGKIQSMRSSGEWFVGHQSKDTALSLSSLQELFDQRFIHMSSGAFILRTKTQTAARKTTSVQHYPHWQQAAVCVSRIIQCWI